jgi:hypothetical protein
MQGDDLKGNDRRKPVVNVAERITVDFVEMLTCLRSRGHGVSMISLHANIPRTSVRDYCDGATPSHPHGERIIRFWCEITGNSREAAPTKRQRERLTASHF